MTNSLILNPMDNMVILAPFQLENGLRKADIPGFIQGWSKQHW